MKKIVAIILAGLMLLSLAACGEKDDVVKIGFIDAGDMLSLNTEEHLAHTQKDNANPTNSNDKFVNYNNLTSALMDLESGKINKLVLEGYAADYVAARNEKFTVVKDYRTANFSMMTMDTNTEVYDILNTAIKAMKEDGTLSSLIENELKAYINSDPEPKDLPHFDGAKTIKVGVTGDIPPMDFVATNGKAAGFNIALLTEIANRAQVNFELVQIETSARPMALSSGTVDVVFWTKSVTCTVCGSEAAETIQGTLVTESYFSDTNALVIPKSDK